MQNTVCPKRLLIFTVMYQARLLYICIYLFPLVFQSFDLKILQHQWLEADAVGDQDLPNNLSHTPSGFQVTQRGGKNPPKPETPALSNHRAGKIIGGYVMDSENTKAEAPVREVKRCSRMKNYLETKANQYSGDTLEGYECRGAAGQAGSDVVWGWAVPGPGSVPGPAAPPRARG